MQFENVGSVGERGISANIVTYGTCDTLVALKGKGTTTPAPHRWKSPKTRLTWARWQCASAGAPNVADAYAFKVERADGSIEYLRSLVARPNTPGGRNEDFVLKPCVLGLN